MLSLLIGMCLEIVNIEVKEVLLKKLLQIFATKIITLFKELLLTCLNEVLCLPVLLSHSRLFDIGLIFL